MNSQVLKVSRTTFLKDPIDAIEIMVPSSKEKRKALSTSKLRSKITNHSPSAPFQKEKSSSIIQKHIEKVPHSTFSTDKRNSEGNIAKSKRPQSGKLRKGVTYRAISKKKILDVGENILCSDCKIKCSAVLPCSRCGNDSKHLNISVELKQIPNSSEKFVLVLSKKEVVLNIGEPVDVIIKLNERRTQKSLEIDLKNDINFNSLYLGTPSFQGIAEKYLESCRKRTDQVSDFEVSFAEGHEEFNDINKKIEELDMIVKGFVSEVRESKIKEFSEKFGEVIEDVSSQCNVYIQEYLAGVKRVIDSYFKSVMNKLAVGLVHKKLDVRLGKNTLGIGLQNTSKF